MTASIKIRLNLCLIGHDVTNTEQITASEETLKEINLKL